MTNEQKDKFLKEFGAQMLKTGVLVKDMVNHPDHYGGKDNIYEHIKVVEAWGLDYWTGNATKYIARAGKKDPSKEIEDLRKAIFYLQDKVNRLEKKQCQHDSEE